METLTRSASIRDRVRAWRAAGRRIALVPTRGTLHKGHMRLVAEAQERADQVIVSRCANPPQRDAPMLEADRDLLSKIGPDLSVHSADPGGLPRRERFLRARHAAQASRTSSRGRSGLRATSAH